MDRWRRTNDKGIDNNNICFILILLEVIYIDINSEAGKEDQHE